MAEAVRELKVVSSDTSPRATTAGESASSEQQPKKFPKGVVLGKDGKPCRNCTSFASWAAQAKQKVAQGAVMSNTATGSAVTNIVKNAPLADCPPDVEVLGRSTWTLLHSIAATYPETPSRTQQSDLLSFVGLFSKLYPCWVCAEDFQGYIAQNVPRVANRDEFGQWLCDAHNDVNKKLGKSQFDCSRWEERWRTGWKDGRCD